MLYHSCHVSIATFANSIEVLHHHVTRVATVTRPPCWMACTCKTHYDLIRDGGSFAVFLTAENVQKEIKIYLSIKYLQ